MHHPLPTGQLTSLMLVLFDHGTPAPLIPFLEGHTVTKAKDAGWDRLINGELLKSLRKPDSKYC